MGKSKDQNSNNKVSEEDQMSVIIKTRNKLKSCYKTSAKLEVHLNTGFQNTWLLFSTS